MKQIERHIPSGFDVLHDDETSEGANSLDEYFEPGFADGNFRWV